jgi:hypothetical protein
MDANGNCKSCARALKGNFDDLRDFRRSEKASNAKHAAAAGSRTELAEAPTTIPTTNTTTLDDNNSMPLSSPERIGTATATETDTIEASESLFSLSDSEAADVL